MQLRYFLLRSFLWISTCLKIEGLWAFCFVNCCRTCFSNERHCFIAHAYAWADFSWKRIFLQISAILLFSTLLLLMKPSRYLGQFSMILSVFFLSLLFCCAPLITTYELFNDCYIYSIFVFSTVLILGFPGTTFLWEILLCSWHYTSPST
jgi:hypothetical protein